MKRQGKKPKFDRSPAPRLVPLAHTGRLPLYRIKVPNNFKDLLVGCCLSGKYWVLKVIGRGGMSVVYKAVARDSGNIVAVKTLRTQGMTDEMLVKRFQREAELLSRLNHPRIVNLHAYGTSAKGQPYFVMDYLRGENLTNILGREDHLEPERFQDIFVQVCAAIEHAHRHAAIHRDIKPGNIMLTQQGDTSDYVKIVDFGIAKMAEEAQRLTRMGEVWGSPIYMSPEQCMGAPVDERADIYSLGVVMYECLTGKVPFMGKNYADTMSRQISDSPQPFAQKRPELAIPESLEKIVMHAMEKDPEKRYQTMGAMKKDLQEALSYTKGKETSSSATSPRISASNMKKIDVRKSDSKRPSDLRTSGKVSDPKRTTTPSTTITRRARPTKKNNRLKKIFLVAGGSLILSVGLIALLSNTEAVGVFLTKTIKTLVSGLDDNTTPYDLDNQQPKQTQ
jgi:serine/threonine protein kinase